MITVFTTKTCAYCGMVKKFLESKGIKFETIDLDDNPGYRQALYEETGAMTVPITEKDGKYVIGWNPAKLKELINDGGQSSGNTATI